MGWLLHSPGNLRWPGGLAEQPAQELMPRRSVVARLAALPLHHKLFAAGIALGIATLGFVLAQSQPSEFASSAVLAFDASRAAANTRETSPASNSPSSPAAQAEEILSDGAFQSLMKRQFPGAAIDPGNAALRTHLSLTDLPSSKVRVSWRGQDQAQTVAVTNAIAGFLTSWVPPDIRPAIASPPPQPAAPAPSATIPKPVTPSISQTAPDQNQSRRKALRQEEADLQSQLDATERQLEALDREQTQLQTSASQARLAEVTKEIAHLRSTRMRLLQAIGDREAQEDSLGSGEASSHRSAPASKKTPSAGSVGLSQPKPSSVSKQPAPPAAAAVVYTPLKSPFTMVENAHSAQPLNTARWLLEWLGIAFGVLSGGLYLAFALRRLITVESAESLKQLLPVHVAIIGTIPSTTSRMIR